MLQIQEDAPVRVTISATGRCINKLVTIVEVVKTLIVRELHQYNVMGTVTVPSADSDEDDDEEEEAVTKNPPLKSQLFITLSTHKISDLTTCGYQHHNPVSCSSAAPSQGVVDMEVVGQDVITDIPAEDRVFRSTVTRKEKVVRYSRQGRGKVKKKDLEDAKNVLY